MTNGVKKTTDAKINDMLLDDLDKFEHFTVTYLKQIIAGCIAIIVIVAIAVTGYALHGSAERKAENVIANAKTVDELQKVINEYSGKKAVWSAYQKLIKAYVEKKDFPKALEFSQALLKLNIPEEMRWPLELNTGYMMEIAGNKGDAINKFATISKDNAFPANVRIEAYFSAGRIEASRGDKTAARSYLEAAAKNQVGATSGEGDLWQKLATSMLMNLDKPAKTEAKAEPVKADAAKVKVPAKK